MKKGKKALKIIAVVLAIIIVAAAAAGGGLWKSMSDYPKKLDKTGLMSNSAEQALPQTVIHKLIAEHFAAPLPEGKTVKKAIFLGYDGFRADALVNVADMENSGIMYVRSKGGLYNSFAGGVKGGFEQKTSTAPGWMAMLTGGWGDYNGIDDNGKVKNPEADTILTKLAKEGRSASFTASWREHTGLSYRPDIINSIEQGYNVEYTHQPDDAGTYYQVLKYAAKPAAEKTDFDPDMIFFTFEHTDNAGHSSGFSNKNENYCNAAREMDEWGYNIIKTIEARSTYAQEDWLIIIGTDHGGFTKGHGMQTPFERDTWFACNREVEINEENLTFAFK